MAREGARSSSPISTLRRRRSGRCARSKRRGEALGVARRCAGQRVRAGDGRRGVERFGQIDILFHNAVSVPLVNNHDRRITELPEETWHKIVDLVLTGTFLTAKYVAQHMLAQSRVRSSSPPLSMR